MSHQTVTVDLGERRYDILIGANLLDRAGEFIAPMLKNPRIAIVTDETVAHLHLPTLTQALAAQSIQADAYILPAGERTKSFEHLQSLSHDFLDAGYERGDFIIALGGGVIGDLTGFAASIYKRGCGYIQVPTTLLSQVDSSVGGKTAINTIHGKNLIGAFYQPSLVIADTDVLSTLPDRQRRAGYAEIVKYGLLGDADFFSWLEEHGEAVLSGAPDALSYAIAKSCQMKADIVAQDEREIGRRALLNLGHTFAHSLEAEAGYSGALLHGEAVAAGMALAYDYSAARGICSAEAAARVTAHLQRMSLKLFADLPPDIRANPETHMRHMSQDKKNSGGKLTLILPRAIGDSYVERDADTVSLSAFWAAQLNRCG